MLLLQWYRIYDCTLPGIFGLIFVAEEKNVSCVKINQFHMNEIVSCGNVNRELILGS